MKSNEVDIGQVEIPDGVTRVEPPFLILNTNRFTPEFSTGGLSRRAFLKVAFMFAAAACAPTPELPPTKIPIVTPVPDNLRATPTPFSPVTPEGTPILKATEKPGGPYDSAVGTDLAWPTYDQIPETFAAGGPNYLVDSEAKNVIDQYEAVRTLIERSQHESDHVFRVVNSREDIMNPWDVFLAMWVNGKAGNQTRWCIAGVTSEGFMMPVDELGNALDRPDWTKTDSTGVVVSGYAVFKDGLGSEATRLWEEASDHWVPVVRDVEGKKLAVYDFPNKRFNTAESLQELETILFELGYSPEQKASYRIKQIEWQGKQYKALVYVNSADGNERIDGMYVERFEQWMRGLYYEVPGQEWAGGFSIDLMDPEGKRIQFTDEAKGPNDLLSEVLRVVNKQTGGSYGEGNTRVSNFVYIKTDPIDMDRSPPWVIPSDPVALDLSLPIKIYNDNNTPEGGTRLRLSDSRLFSSMSVIDGQLVFVEGINTSVPVMYSTDIIRAAVGLRIRAMLEAVANINTSEYFRTQGLIRPNDYMSIIESHSGRYYVPGSTVTRQELFYTYDKVNNKYSFVIFSIFP